MAAFGELTVSVSVPKATAALLAIREIIRDAEDKHPAKDKLAAIAGIAEDALEDLECH